jgi:hypothetical protein
MSKDVAAMLVLFFMVASCTVVVKPVFSLTDVTENTWEPLTPINQARGFLGVAAVSGKLYAIGGQVLAYQDKLRTESKAVGTNEEYDTTTDTWTYKKPMPTPKANFGITVYRNKIYCMSENVNEVYDPETDTWETKKPMPTPRIGVGANVVNGKIYVTGGYVRNSSSLTGFTFLSLNEVYDPETDSWTTKTPMNTSVAGFRSVVVNSKIYVIQDGLNQIYDAVTDAWSFGKPQPYTSMMDLRVVATTGVNAPKRIYGFGGGKTQVYDPEADSWTFGVDMTSTGGFGVCVVDDVMYVIGGFSMTFPSMLSIYKNPTIAYYATVERYTPFGYGTPDPSYDGTAPEITVASPANKTYFTADTGLNFTDGALNFTVEEPVFSVHYVLDGGIPVEISGNTTLTELAVGAHNVTVFGFDASGNMGTSGTVYFSIADPEFFSTTLVAAVSIVAVAVVSVGLLAYFKGRKHY